MRKLSDFYKSCRSHGFFRDETDIISPPAQEWQRGKGKVFLISIHAPTPQWMDKTEKISILSFRRGEIIPSSCYSLTDDPACQIQILFDLSKTSMERELFLHGDTTKCLFHPPFYPFSEHDGRVGGIRKTSPEEWPSYQTHYFLDHETDHMQIKIIAIR